MIFHRRLVIIACVTSLAALIGFRVLIELGYGVRGGRVFLGVPVEYVFLSWFLLLCAVVFDRSRLDPAAERRATFHEWWLSIFGLAGTLFLLGGLGRAELLTSANWVYFLAAVSVGVVFISSALVARTDAVLKQVLADAMRVLRRPVTWVCVAGIMSLFGAAPRSGEVPSGDDAFRRWYTRQPRVRIPVGWQLGKVTLVELVDYQCSICREVELRYADLFQRVWQLYGDAFQFRRVDFPLENECNATGNVTEGGLHLASCEAAVAVRLAGAKSAKTATEVARWLWIHQRSLTREGVFEQMEREFELPIRQRYDEILREVRSEAAEGRALGVSGTPTFFLNGRRLLFLSAAAMEVAITWEFNAVGTLPGSSEK